MANDAPGKDLGGGLSDFGLTNQNDSTSIQGGPGLEQLIAELNNMGTSAVTEAQRGQALEEKLAGQGGLLEKLKSPKGIALLLGALGVGAAGGGASGAAAFGLGAAGGLSQDVEKEKKGLQAALADSDKKLESIQQKFSTAFNTNPEAFIDPDTGQPVVDARVLGWYMTGTTIPMYPQTRRLMNQRDERWKSRMEVLTGALEDADTKEDRRNLTGAVLRQLQWFDPPAEVVNSLVNAMGTDDFDQAFAATLVRHGGQTGIDAIIRAGEMGLPLQHPEIMRGVQFRSDTGSTTPSQELNQRLITDMEIVNKFSVNPINAEFVKTVNANNAPDDARKIIAEKALEGEGTGEIDFYIDRVNAMGPKDFDQLMKAYSIGSSKRRIVDTMRGVNDTTLKEQINMSDEEYRNFEIGEAQQFIGDAQDAARQSVAVQIASQRNTIAQQIQASLPGLGVEGVYSLLNQVMAAALEDAKKDADGAVNRADFDRLLKIYAEKAIKDNKEQ